jgi:hypothetical protein
MIDPGRRSRSAEGGPGGGITRTGALAFPGDLGDRWGNADSHFKRGGIRFHKQKGRRRPPRCPGLLFVGA